MVIVSYNSVIKIINESFTFSKRFYEHYWNEISNEQLISVRRQIKEFKEYFKADFADFRIEVGFRRVKFLDHRFLFHTRTL